MFIQVIEQIDGNPANGDEMTLEGPLDALALEKRVEALSADTQRDPRWNVVDLREATVIWGDTSDHPGVFHFCRVPLSDNVQEMIDAARRSVYEDPEFYDMEDEPIVALMEESYTLVAVLVGSFVELHA